MNNLIEFFKNIWEIIDPVIELSIYVGIAYVISRLFGITYMQSVGIVFGYFLLNVVRIFVEVYRDKNK
jgi:hypothetical protein